MSVGGRTSAGGVAGVAGHAGARGRVFSGRWLVRDAAEALSVAGEVGAAVAKYNEKIIIKEAPRPPLSELDFEFAGACWILKKDYY